MKADTLQMGGEGRRVESDERLGGDGEAEGKETQSETEDIGGVV